MGFWSHQYRDVRNNVVKGLCLYMLVLHPLTTCTQTYLNYSPDFNRSHNVIKGIIIHTLKMQLQTLFCLGSSVKLGWYDKVWDQIGDHISSCHQAQHPNRPPCQPLRGNSSLSKPPTGLHTDEPLWLLPWKDGLPSGTREGSAEHEPGT